MPASLEVRAKGGQVVVTRRVFASVEVERDHIHTMGLPEAEAFAQALSSSIADAHKQALAEAQQCLAPRLREVNRQMAALQDEQAELLRALDAAQAEAGA